MNIFKDFSSLDLYLGNYLFNKEGDTITVSLGEITEDLGYRYSSLHKVKSSMLLLTKSGAISSDKKISSLVISDRFVIKINRVCELFKYMDRITKDQFDKIANSSYLRKNNLYITLLAYKIIERQNSKENLLSYPAKIHDITNLYPTTINKCLSVLSEEGIL